MWLGLPGLVCQAGSVLFSCPAYPPWLVVCQTPSSISHIYINGVKKREGVREREREGTHVLSWISVATILGHKDLKHWAALQHPDYLCLSFYLWLDSGFQPVLISQPTAHKAIPGKLGTLRG